MILCLYDNLEASAWQVFAMIVSMFLSLFHCILNIFATGERANHRGEYGLEISANFHFYEPEKSIKMAKKITKIKENLNETLKHCLK